MIDEKLNKMFYQIKSDCFKLIEEKDVDLEELAYQMGVSVYTLVDKFSVRDKDFSFYLKAYNLLEEWQV